MFVSISNNFGAGQIQFKDYQCDKYIVLNAKFTVNTSSPAYLAASRMEIKVPDLSIGRSVEVPVAIRFTDRRTISGQEVNCDGGTVLISKVADKNTIVIERHRLFDNKGVVTIIISAMYATLNNGNNPQKVQRAMLRIQQETQYLIMSDSSYFVTDEHWVFLCLCYSECQYAYKKQPWEAALVNFPTDAAADVAFIGGVNGYNPKVCGMSEAHIENGVFTMQERMYNFCEGYPKPFVFAFIVRDSQ
jgi:hypothetical protein